MRTINGISYRTKEDLEDSCVGLEQYQPGQPSVKDLFIRVTSGTSGTQPTVLVVSFAEVKKNILAKGRRLFAEPLLVVLPRNLSSVQWVQLFFDPAAESSRILFLSRRELEHPLLAKIIDEFQPRHVFSTVSLFDFLLDTLATRNGLSGLAAVERLFITGETLSHTVKQKFEALVPEAAIEMSYGISEVGGGVGAYCATLYKRHPDSFGRAYHPLLPLSIVEPDENGVGEIALTTRELGPYLTGDAGRLVAEPCACGATETLFVEGRINYDIVHCVGATFHAALVEKIFASLREYVEDYYLEIREVQGEGKTLGFVACTVVPTAKLRAMKNGVEYVCEFLEKNLQITKTQSLGDLVRVDIFMKPFITYAEILPKSVKYIRMRKVD